MSLSKWKDHGAVCAGETKKIGKEISVLLSQSSNGIIEIPTRGQVCEYISNVPTLSLL